MPWVLPFERRVNIFRELVERERGGLPGEDLPEHIKGTRIKVRREHLLEDGYVQLGNLAAEQIKGTVRVEFISEVGMAEAGIDRTGVFKEFIEDTVASAFDPNRGLFSSTVSRDLHPSASSAAADPNHLRMFEFVGRVLGKAISPHLPPPPPPPPPTPPHICPRLPTSAHICPHLHILAQAIYEGVVLELPLARFFVAKLLGKFVMIDELPSLDAELASSLAFLKKCTEFISPRSYLQDHGRHSISARWELTAAGTLFL